MENRWNDRDGGSSNRIWIIGIAVVLVLTVCLVGGYLLFFRNPPGTASASGAESAAAKAETNAAEGVTKAASESQTESTTSAAVTGSSEAPVEKWQEGVITYEGTDYRYNTHIKTYLFLGIDSDEPVHEAKDGISGGQSDAMFLMVFDNENRRISVIAINRNTMTDVDVYNEAGEFEGTYPLQICLQHGYGDGMKTSCQRTLETVERLFNNIPISGYISLNMGGIGAMNDSVGGVELTILEDVESSDGSIQLKEGETVRLKGDEAYVYLRKRDVEEFDSASRRLERQRQYLTSFIPQLRTAISGDPKVANELYEAIEEYIVSNLDIASMVKTSQSYTFGEENIYTVPGETVMGEEFEEYNVDEDALYELILEVFYNKV